MSQENVKFVREGFEYFERTGEPLMESLHPDIEVFDHDIPDAGIYRGSEGYLKWLADWSEAWESFGLEPLRWIDADDQVVFLFQITAKGKGSGVEVKRHDAMVSTIRDGKVVRLDYYNDQSQAIEAAGLSVQDAGAG
jgi:ketosteroid isomerase-like protein